ncbi:MAG: hypothetical protein GF310_01985 [candidate division Zixibacteria bacterium]|nr:hypothetical protein [candidate division Zixibacteria bacterium]
MYKKHFIFILLVAILLILSCSSDKGFDPNDLGRGDFELEAQYSYIRSSAGGAGHFIIRLLPENNFEGNVALDLSAKSYLHACLDRKCLNSDSNVAEITINPDSRCEFKTYQIELRAVNADTSCTVFLDVEIMDWIQYEPEYPLKLLEDFDQWLSDNHPELSGLSRQEWYCYDTYPQIIIVSHWTLLNSEYEIRICHHVMIHPHNWTKFRLRKRGEFESELAAMRENDSTAIHEMPVSEYPTLFGY